MTRPTRPPKPIRVLVYEPGKPGVERDVPNELGAMHAIVGGHLETVHLQIDFPDLLVVCNDNGQRLGLAFNRGILGTFFVVRRAGAEFASLTDADVRLVHTLAGVIWHDDVW